MLLILILAHQSHALAQQRKMGHVLIEGKVYVNDRGIPNAFVNIYLRDKQFTHTFSGVHGTFKVNLPFNHKFRIEIGKQGLVSKQFIINTELPSGVRDDQIYVFNLQLDLFPPFEEVDMSLLFEPMAYIGYDHLTGSFGFDLEAAEEKVRKVQALQKEIETILAIKARLFRLEFNNAEVAFMRMQYTLALDDYKKALRVYPPNTAHLYIDVTYIRDQIATIEALLAERKMQERNKALKQQLDVARNRADNALRQKLYDDAAENYRKVLLLKPDDRHAQIRLDTIIAIVSRDIIVNFRDYPSLLRAGSEIKLPLARLGASLKKGNYLIIKVKRESETEGKMVIRYGNEKERGGNFSISDIPAGQFREHYIRLGTSYQWSRMDVAWISISVEDCDISLGDIRLSRTE